MAKKSPLESHNKNAAIGVFISSAEDKYENAILRGVHSVASQAEVRVICFTSGALRSYHGFEAKRNILYDLVNPDLIDGMVISGVLGHNIPFNEMTAFCHGYDPLPMTTIAVAIEGIPSVFADSYHGTHAVVSHFIKTHNCQKIAFIRGPQGQSEADDRYMGYCDALGENGIAFEPQLVANGDYTRASGMAAMRELLANARGKFDAVVAANDSMILGAYESLRAAGLRIPEDIAIAGFDDTEEGQNLFPPLTTVRQSVYDQGRNAARILLSKISGGQVPALTNSPASIVVRQSCGCKRFGSGEIPRSAADSIPQQRDAICAAIIESVKQSAIDIEPSLVSELYDIASTGSTQDFLKNWDEVLQRQKLGEHNNGYSVLLNTLMQHLAPNFGESATQLWNQAHAMITTMEVKWQASLRLKAEEQTVTLREIGEMMVTTFSMNELLEVVALELPRLGVEACFLSLYENPQKPAGNANLILAYDKNGRKELPKGGISFPAPQLVPDDLFSPQTSNCLMVEALYSKDAQLGFAILEMPPQMTNICGTVRGHLSSALQGVLLWEQRQQAEARLRQQQNQLEQMVAARTSALIKTNLKLEHEIAERLRVEEKLKLERDHLDQRREMMTRIIDLGQRIAKVTDLDGCLRQVHHSIRHDLGFDRVGLFLYDASTDTIQGAYGTDRNGEIEDTSWFIQRASDFEPWRIALKNPSGLTIVEDYQSKHQFGDESEMFGVKQHLTLSAWVGEAPIAIMAVDNVISQRPITAEDVEALRLFSGYVGLAIHNARLNEELEQRVEERTAQLEAANKELESFSYSVSHDLRAPLRAIRGYSDILLKDFSSQLDPMGKDFLNKVGASARQMGELIDSLLALSRLSRSELKPVEVDLSNMANEIIHTLKQTDPTRPVTCFITEGLSVQADERLIYTALENLLNNAWKYTSKKEIAHIEFGSKEEERQTIYFVRDNGAGFDMAYAGRLFGAFQRLHADSEFPGHGIGLASVQRIIHKHGGRIWAESETGKGATFYFTINLQP